MNEKMVVFRTTGIVQSIEEVDIAICHNDSLFLHHVCIHVNEVQIHDGVSLMIFETML